MGKSHAPRRGTLQFWPHRRARSEAARIRNWPSLKDIKPLGFVAYKAGMCHITAIDNRPKALTKGEEISVPATILECPPLKVVAIQYYQSESLGSKMVSSVRAAQWDKEMERVLPLHKKQPKQIEKQFDDVRLLVATQPKMTGIGTKKPKIMEIALSGTKEEKLKYAHDKLGKEIAVSEVFKEGNYVDVHAVTTGKGFQGPVKRFGVMLRHHKSEKARRANVRGSWSGPSMWTAPHSAKMGYHLRTEFNKQILRIGMQPDDVRTPSGIMHYGVVKNNYLLLKGSVIGPKKRIVTLIHATRQHVHLAKEAPLFRSVVL